MKSDPRPEDRPEDRIDVRTPLDSPRFERLDVAAWLVDLDGVLVRMNGQAHELLGLQEGDLLNGATCYELVRGSTESGHAFCTESCVARCEAKRLKTLAPMLLEHRSEDHDSRWVLVFFIPVEAPARAGEATYLVHLAYPMSRYLRVRDYWERILQGVPRNGPPRAVLSPRQQEILERMARGDDLKRIARELFVSYVTVRNHVQHILEKLHVHSTQEAIALHLLEETPRPAGATDGRRAVD